MIKKSRYIKDLRFFYILLIILNRYWVDSGFDFLFGAVADAAVEGRAPFARGSAVGDPP